MTSRAAAAHDLIGAAALAWAWGPMLVALALFGARPGPLTFLVAFVIVGGRQHSLDILAHECWHYTLFKRRPLNQVAGAWLCAFPCLSRFTALRLKHFEHHRKVGTLADPDRFYWGWERSERKEFLRHHFMSASGLWFVRHLLGRVAGVRPSAAPADPNARPREVGIPFGPEDRKEFVGVVVWHLAALAAFTFTIGWIWYFLLWLLPLLTLRSLINDLRQFLEHRHGRLLVYNTHALERFFLGPFNFHLHGYHHAFPQEPWFLLPTLGERARRKCPDILDYDTYLGELVAFLGGHDRQGSAADLPTAPRGDASTLPASG